MAAGCPLRHYANLDFSAWPDAARQRTRAVHQTHFRQAGDGPPLILLHPSPLSSEFMVPLVDLVADKVTAIAPDTPGYGQSDPLPAAASDLVPYVHWLAGLVRKLGHSSVGLYGSATGAQIAIQFARVHPEMTRYLVLDNAVHFHADERQDILANYFPDLSPQADGSHLQRAWEMSSGLFWYFPWYDQREQSRVSQAAPPLHAVHATALAYLVAGVDYDMAYRAAFRNEDAANMQQISVPTRVIRWAGGMLKKYADRLDDFDWPENIRMVHCGKPVEKRFAAIREQIVELSGQTADQSPG